MRTASDYLQEDAYKKLSIQLAANPLLSIYVLRLQYSIIYLGQSNEAG
jgi:hypothetical protein